MDDLDRGFRDAQLFCHDLGKDRLMALPVAVRPTITLMLPVAFTRTVAAS